jgi:Arc/MetJ family transcription regulator
VPVSSRPGPASPFPRTAPSGHSLQQTGTHPLHNFRRKSGNTGQIRQINQNHGFSTVTENFKGNLTPVINFSPLDGYAQFVHIDAYNSHKETFMRTTLNIEDALIEKAALLTGITEKTSLVRLGLQALIARESSKRLALLGGTEKNLMTIPRRRGGA